MDYERIMKNLGEHNHILMGNDKKKKDVCLKIDLRISLFVFNFKGK